MWQIVIGDWYRSAPFHFKKSAEIALKQMYPFGGHVEKTPFFMQPNFMVLHEWELLKIS